MKKRILDLFAGAGGEIRRGFIESQGFEYVTSDIEPRFKCDITKDVLSLSHGDVDGFDFIWASPPCEAFSVASIGHHWGGGVRAYIPKTEHALLSQRIVEHTRMLLETANPSCGFLIENPRGVLRKLPALRGLPMRTICYCRYGDTRMKPTDIWGNVPNMTFMPMCHNGNPDHEAAPRGARTGTQGIKGADMRSVVPVELWRDILNDNLTFFKPN